MSNVPWTNGTPWNTAVTLLLLQANSKIRIACWHADMDENELLQIARMVQDNNLPTRHQLPIHHRQDERFIHPDDVRGHEVDAVNTALNSLDNKSTGPIVVVTTDAALRMVPSVCCLLHVDDSRTCLQADLLCMYKYLYIPGCYLARQEPVKKCSFGAMHLACCHC